MEGLFAGPHAALLVVTQQHFQPGGPATACSLPGAAQSIQAHRDAPQSQRPALHLQSLGSNPSFAGAQVPPLIEAPNLAPRLAVSQQLRALQKQQC